MSVNKLFDVTQFQGNNVTVLRRILDQISHDALTFKFTDTIPTDETVNHHEVVLYDDGAGNMRMCVKTGKGNLFCVNVYPGLMPGPPVTGPIIGPTTYVIDPDTDMVILGDASAGQVFVTLPDAVAYDGRTFYIKRMNSGTGIARRVTVNCTGGQTIDNDTEQNLTVRYATIQVYSTGVNWVII